jgi:hypothetical protein
MVPMPILHGKLSHLRELHSMLRLNQKVEFLVVLRLPKKKKIKQQLNLLSSQMIRNQLKRLVSLNLLLTELILASMLNKNL